MVVGASVAVARRSSARPVVARGVAGVDVGGARGFRCGVPVDRRGVEEPKASTHHARGDFCCRQAILQRSVEATEESAVEQADVVRCAEHEAVGLVLLEELEERVEHAADLADVVLAASLAAKGIELVEEVHATRGLDRVENEPELGRGLAEVRTRWFCGNGAVRERDDGVFEVVIGGVIIGWFSRRGREHGCFACHRSRERGAGTGASCSRERSDLRRPRHGSDRSAVGGVRAVSRPGDPGAHGVPRPLGRHSRRPEASPRRRERSRRNGNPRAVGCRNWLFVGSDDGAVTTTRFVSLLASARLHDIEPLWTGETERRRGTATSPPPLP
jgi:hypothetical protein